MVGAGFDVAFAEALGEALGVLAADAVDDGGFVVVAFEDGLDLVDESDTGEDSVGEIGSVEGPDVDGGFAQVELLDDVVADALGCGGGEGVDGGLREAGAEFGDASVLGSEVVPPVADAMGFVDGDGVEVDVVKESEEARGEEAFGGDVEEVEFSGAGAAFDVFGFAVAEVGVEGCGGEVDERECVDLVLHEGDEG